MAPLQPSTQPGFVRGGARSALVLAAAALISSSCSDGKVIVSTPPPCPDNNTQIRKVDGYCTCRDESLRYNSTTQLCEECVGTCEGIECGSDGCGASCGQCGEGASCRDGLCVACQPQCSVVECGADGCGGTCGICGEGRQCEQGRCVKKCVAQCMGKSCGADGCGGTCGACGSSKTCSANGVCISTGLACGTAITPCSCATAPAGAFLGATRLESNCSSGFAVFSICSAYCYDPFGYPTGIAWGEVCGC